MNKILTMNDTINIGKNKKVLVSDIVQIKGEIFNLIKKGLQFDDEVLEKAHIKKTNKDVKVTNAIVSHDKPKDKKYEKETENLRSILKSLNTLENQATEIIENVSNNEEDSYIEEEEEE